MTYNVSSGTLNSTIPYYTVILLVSNNYRSLTHHLATFDIFCLCLFVIVYIHFAQAHGQRKLASNEVSYHHILELLLLLMLLQLEIDEVESRNEEYPMLLAFLELMSTLIDSPVPSKLGAGFRVPGFEPYLDFLRDSVLLKFASRAYKRPADKVFEEGFSDCLRWNTVVVLSYVAMHDGEYYLPVHCCASKSKYVKSQFIQRIVVKPLIALNAPVRCKQKRLQRLSETVPANNRILQAVQRESQTDGPAIQKARRL